MKLTRVIVRGLPAQFRQRETQLFLLALLFAVAALTAVQLGAQRTLNLLLAQAAAINGGDLSVSSRAALPTEWQQAARERGLRTASSLTFPSMLFAGEQQQLADIKAIAGDYPVRGALKLRLANGTVQDSAPLPSTGEAYADARLLDSLAISVGDELELGELRLRVAAELLEDPDGNQLFAMAPRLLVGIDDATRAGLLGPGSRPAHRLHMAGERWIIQAFDDWLKEQVDGSQRIGRVDDAMEQLRGAYQRGRAFIDLALLLTLALSAMAMWLALARLAERETAQVALLRCLGARRSEVLGMPLGQILLLALPATIIGVVLGFVVENRIGRSLAERFAIEMPAVDPLSAWPALLLLIGLLLLCVLPPLFGLLRVSPLQALNNAVGQRGQPVRWLALPLLGLPLAGLLLGGEPRLVLLLLAGLAGAAGLCALLLRGVLYLLARSSRHSRGITRLALQRLVRQPLLAVLQGTALTVALTALLLATRVGPDLLGQWRSALPENTPNWFVINIQDGQRADVLDFLQTHQASALTMMPVATGRLSAVNGKPASEHTLPDPTMQRWRDGPLNLSWSDQLPEGNTVTSGDWWSADDNEAVVSLEQRFAERLGVALDDRLDLTVGDRTVSVRIANLRSTDWDSFRVNFFLVLNPAAAVGITPGHIASFHLPESAAGNIRELTRQHANLSPIDIGAILGRIRDLVGELSSAARALLSLALFAATLVMLGALVYAQAERRREAALLRALGMRRGELARLQLVEWLLLGAVSALVASVLASVTGWLLAGRVFQFDYRLDGGVFLVAVLVAGVVTLIAALMASRTATRTPPADSLRA